MSFTDQKPFTVSKKDLDARWNCGPASESLKCAWCGHTFQLGDTARWVYTNSEPHTDHIYGNPFICSSCDGPREEILEKLREMSLAARTKYWFFLRS
jgi:hypothetical protein